jgi:AraC family transcriptional regulator of adaptative response/methylated-DNA-[protein]-cysteine methyltransferase
MTPGEYKNGGENLIINYSFEQSHFGTILIASTSKGICHISFVEKEEDSFLDLQKRFPKANYLKGSDQFQRSVLPIFKAGSNNPGKIKLHLKGTEFQLKVWEALLKVPQGKLVTYGTIANNIEKPKASRAVGTAIGDNPIAYIIPCHRVILSNGLFGGYMWGRVRKTAIIGWEAASLLQDEIIH